MKFRLNESLEGEKNREARRGVLLGHPGGVLLTAEHSAAALRRTAEQWPGGDQEDAAQLLDNGL